MTEKESEDTQRKIYDKFEAHVAEEILRWISGIVGDEGGEINTSGDVNNFLAVLQDGTVLCRLADKLEPGVIKKFNASTLAFKKMENISFFLTFAARYVSPIELFQTIDLYEEKNPNAVLVCLSALARKAKQFRQPGVGSDSQKQPPAGDDDVVDVPAESNADQLVAVPRARLPYDINIVIVEKLFSECYSMEFCCHLMMINREFMRIFKRLMCAGACVLMTVFDERVHQIEIMGPNKGAMLRPAEYFYISREPTCAMKTHLVCHFSVRPQDVGGEFNFIIGRAKFDITTVRFYVNFPPTSHFLTFNFDVFQLTRWRNALVYIVRECVNISELIIELGNIVMNVDQVFEFLSAMQLLIRWYIREMLPFIFADKTCVILNTQFAISNAIYRLNLSEKETILNCRVFNNPEIQIFFKLLTIIVIWIIPTVLPILHHPSILSIWFEVLPPQTNIMGLLEQFRQATGLISSAPAVAFDNDIFVEMKNGAAGSFSVYWMFPASAFF